MATASGMSVFGLQTLVNNVVVSSKLVSLTFPGRIQPPVQRFGYFWLFTFDSNAPKPHYIVEKGTINSPGLLFPIRLGPLGASYLYRMDVNWALPGIAWTVNVA